MTARRGGFQSLVVTLAAAAVFGVVAGELHRAVAQDAPKTEPPKVEAAKPEPPPPPDAPRALEFAQRDARRFAALAESATQAVAVAQAALTADAQAAAERAQLAPGSPEAIAAVAKFDADAKAATDALVAAEKRAVAAMQRAAEAAATVARYEQAAPVPDPQNLRLVATYTHDGPGFCCRFDPLGEFLYAGAQANTLARWDLASGARTTFAGHRTWIRRFDLSPDGTRLASGAYDGRVIQWDARSPSPKPLRTIDAHAGYARCVAFSPDGQWLVTGGNDALVKVWSVADGKPVATLTAHAESFSELVGKTDQVFRNHVYDVAFHPSGRSFVSGDLMGVVKEWEVGTWKPLRDYDASPLHKYDTTFHAHVGGTRGMDFSPDGKLLIAAGIGEVSNAFAGIGVVTVVLFDHATGERRQIMKGAKMGQGTCWGVRFHPSSRLIAATGGGTSGALLFWRTGEATAFHEHKLPQNGYDVAWHPDGLRLAVALYDKTIQVYDLGPKPEVAAKK